MFPRKMNNRTYKVIELLKEESTRHFIEIYDIGTTEVFAIAELAVLKSQLI